MWNAAGVTHGRITRRIACGLARRVVDRLITESRGQALAEFALISIVFITLLAGAIDLGRIFYINITIANAARSGALQAAETPASYTVDGTGQLNGCPVSATQYDDNRIVCAVQAETRSSAVSISPAQIAIACEDYDLTVVDCPSIPTSGIRSRVTVTATFAPLTPLISAITGNSISVTSSAVADQPALPTAVLPPTAPPPPASPTPTPSPTPGPSEAPLEASFAVATSPRCAGQAVDFVDTSSGGPTEWAWDFGDDTTSTDRSPSHAYGAAGSYTVTLRVTKGTESDAYSGTVPVGDVPAAAFTPAALTIDAGTTVQFADKSAGSPSINAWAWDFGDKGAGNTSSAQNPSHLYNGTRKAYTVHLRVTNGCGSSETSGTITTR